MIYAICCSIFLAFEMLNFCNKLLVIVPKNEKILNQSNEALFYIGRVEFLVFIAFNFEDAFLYHYQQFSELFPL